MRTATIVESQLQFVEQECRWCAEPLPAALLPEWCESEAQPSGLLTEQYAQHINQIVDSYHSPVLIMYDDLQVFHDEEECLKRVYSVEEYPNKIHMLSEYYKFHNEVPRLFMLSIAETLDNYIDERRQLEYVKVTNILKKEQPEEKRRPTKHEPTPKLLESIDLSYEDFERRDKKKDAKHKSKKVLKTCGPVQKLTRQHIQSIQHRVRFQSSHGTAQQANRTSKHSSKKPQAPPTLAQNDNTKSCRALSRTKSRGTLQTIFRGHQEPHTKVDNFCQQGETHRVLHHDNKLSAQSIKRSTSKPKLTIYKQTDKEQSKQQQKPSTDLARMRCNSRPLLKPSAVPLKTIDMNKLGGSGRLNLQSSKSNLHNLSRIEKKPSPQPQRSSRKTSIQSRDTSKNSKKATGFSSVCSTQHLQQSQQSNCSVSSNKRNLQNMFSGVLAMKKHRTLGLVLSQQQSN